jgi:hypothetical protein
MVVAGGTPYLFLFSKTIKQRPGKHPSALPRMGENQKIK